MEIRFQNSPKEVKGMSTQELRGNFLVQELMQQDAVKLVYSHYDRVITGGVAPKAGASIALPNEAELRADYFLERRELGIINVGGTGTVTADGTTYTLNKLDCLYLGKGTREVAFSSNDGSARFFLLSAPAHHTYPNSLMTKEQASPVALGSAATSNQRTIYKYIHQEGIQSCQLVMGLTVLEQGSVWNSVPPHTHTRRMEVYFYFDVPEEQRVFHFMGEPQETRHLVMNNHEAVISAPWSVHFGSGTSNYAFIWAMAGENYTFTDMDPAPIATLL
ncbi:5-dehydro-4-deoxy-D-glucuronate isomerase [Sediminibacterium ginsengisoli]|uniref:4-deoxy-L-threo-5-hexosulose-uronate ketol-isomerase n=1 Tax=Sediminibacterium ginsengisoli TaxID=413434 RepID=A0A1T4K3L2_9BACT|nr:5-dehydro-4-deoxy-D-glucuronate isomerase [Sediminibacterium ginsengisoli]SJZ37026.1 4-deoxy-L-threo-5-hexulose uronate isomerase [Sediminibacterium ginsengisoli]